MIEYKDITLKFGKEVLFDNFNLKVKKNEKILLYGKSGSGKSSLIKMLLGFLKADSGKVFFEGEELNKRNIWELRKKITYVSQDTEMWDGKVHDFIQSIFNYKENIKSKNNLEKLNNYLEIVDLDNNIIHKEYNDLSGGEKQRILIVISLLLNRDIYLLDEITSSLDQKTKIKITDYFMTRDDITQIIISHDLVWKNHEDKLKIIELNKGANK